MAKSRKYHYGVDFTVSQSVSTPTWVMTILIDIATHTTPVKQ